MAFKKSIQRNAPGPLNWWLDFRAQMAIAQNGITDDLSTHTIYVRMYKQPIDSEQVYLKVKAEYEEMETELVTQQNELDRMRAGATHTLSSLSQPATPATSTPAFVHDQTEKQNGDKEMAIAKSERHFVKKCRELCRLYTTLELLRHEQLFLFIEDLGIVQAMPDRGNLAFRHNLLEVRDSVLKAVQKSLAYGLEKHAVYMLYAAVFPSFSGVGDITDLPGTESYGTSGVSA